MSDKLVLPAALLLYASAAITYAVCLPRQLRWTSRLARGLFVLGFVLITWLIANIWWTSGRPPFKTLYESLLLLVWCASVIQLVIERAARLPILGAGTSVVMMTALAYAMGNQDLETIKLPPALQSPWFVPHVLVYFVGYGCLLLAAVAAGAYLARPAATIALEDHHGKHSMNYEAVMHRLIITGYILLTVGLILGAVWAKEAWGNYWTWDPKENWALISWLTYTLYFHLRRLPSWHDRASAWLALAGFAVVMFTYLGIQLLPTADSSVHVYQ